MTCWPISMGLVLFLELSHGEHSLLDGRNDSIDIGEVMPKKLLGIFVNLSMVEVLIMPWIIMPFGVNNQPSYHVENTRYLMGEMI